MEQPAKEKESPPEKDEIAEKEAAIETLKEATPAVAKAQPSRLETVLAEDLRDTLLEKIKSESQRAKILAEIKGDEIADQITFVKRWLKTQPAPEAAGQLPAPGAEAASKSLFERNAKAPYELKNGKWSYIG